MKLTSKQTSKQTQIKITQKSKNSKKSKKRIVDDKLLRLVSVANLNAEQIKKLGEIYNRNRSSINVWTEEQIKQFVIDEKIQIKKPDIHRQYYGYCVLYSDKLAGYIIGKKSRLLEQKFLNKAKPNKFDLLFTIGLDENFQGKGIGTRAIDLFIKMYRNKIAHLGNYARKAKLYADIAADNIASIRAFEKNNFHYSHDIKISGKPYKRYSKLVFSS
jgi:GNAT superfamily N-acetyltransferase